MFATTVGHRSRALSTRKKRWPRGASSTTSWPNCTRLTPAANSITSSRCSSKTAATGPTTSPSCRTSPPFFTVPFSKRNAILLIRKLSQQKTTKPIDVNYYSFIQSQLLNSKLKEMSVITKRLELNTLNSHQCQLIIDLFRISSFKTKWNDHHYKAIGIKDSNGQ